MVDDATEEAPHGAPNSTDRSVTRTAAPAARSPFRWAFDRNSAFSLIIAVIVFLSMIFVYIYSTTGTKGDQGIWTNEYARGLITILFSVGTIVIALLLTLTAIFQTDAEAKERFDRGKEVLTLLIGIFGTIVGFYFGSLNSESRMTPQAAGLNSTKSETPTSKEQRTDNSEPKEVPGSAERTKP